LGGRFGGGHFDIGLNYGGLYRAFKPASFWASGILIVGSIYAGNRPAAFREAGKCNAPNV